VDDSFKRNDIVALSLPEQSFSHLSFPLKSTFPQSPTTQSNLPHQANNESSSLDDQNHHLMQVNKSTINTGIGELNYPLFSTFSLLALMTAFLTGLIGLAGWLFGIVEGNGLWRICVLEY
jgi:hypothetical protein